MRIPAFIIGIIILGFFGIGALFGNVASGISEIADFKSPSKRQLMNVRLADLDQNIRKMYDGCRKAEGHSSESKLPYLCVSSQLMPNLPEDIKAALIDVINVPTRNGKQDQKTMEAIAKEHNLGVLDAVGLLGRINGALKACEKVIMCA
jgi:hypothetical protein